MFLVNNLNANQNELQKAVIHLLSSAPSSPVEGQVYHNTTNHHLYFRTNAGWQDVTDALTLGAQAGSWYLDRTNHTGTQAQSTITSLVSDLALKAPLASPTFTGTPAAPTASSGTNTTQLATTAYVIAEIAARFASNDVFMYKGAIDASTNPNYPAGNAGDTYRFSVAGKIGGASGPNVEVGDMIILHVDGSAGGTHASVGADWDIIQTNIDGAVTLTGSQTLTNKTMTLGTNTITGTIAQFNTAVTDADFATLAGSETLTNKTINLTSNTLSGTVAQFNTALSDGDFATIAGSETLTNKTLTTPTIASFTNATHNHQNAAGGGTLAEAALALTDVTTNNSSTSNHGFLKKLSNVASEYMDGTGNWSVPSGSVLRYSANVGNGSSTSIVVTHSLGTKDLLVSLYDNTTPYQVLEPDVKMTSTSTITLEFSVAPTTNQYRVVILG